MQPLQVVDRLLEDVAEDVHVDQPRLGRLGSLLGGSVVVGGQFLEAAADLVGHVQRVEAGVVGEEAAVVGRDVEARVAEVDRPEQAPEVLPDGPGIVGVGVLIGLRDRLRGQKPAVLAEGAEEDPVEDLLRAVRIARGGVAGLARQQVLEGVLAHLGVA